MRQRNLKVGLAEFSRTPVGNGPYKAVSVVAYEGVIMEITKDYFTDSPQGQPHIGNMNFRVIPDAETRLAEMMADVSTGRGA